MARSEASRAQKRRYQANRRAKDPAYKAKQNALCLVNARKTLEKNRKFLLDYKRSHPCVDCGEKDEIVLQFDHIDPSKKSGNVGKFSRSTKAMLREIEKCEIRCANCHARRSRREGHY